jgi:hypothetical protein
MFFQYIYIYIYTVIPFRFSKQICNAAKLLFTSVNDIFWLLLMQSIYSQMLNKLKKIKILEPNKD